VLYASRGNYGLTHRKKKKDSRIMPTSKVEGGERKLTTLLGKTVTLTASPRKMKTILMTGVQMNDSSSLVILDYSQDILL
jgi:hypothetical protein